MMVADFAAWKVYIFNIFTVMIVKAPKSFVAQSSPSSYAEMCTFAHIGDGHWYTISSSWVQVCVREEIDPERG